MAERPRRSRDDSEAHAGFRGMRLEGLIREELNSLLESEVTDPRLEDVRASRVELTRDGSRARVWFVTTQTEARALAGIDAAFVRASGFLRSRLCEALPLKRSPELRFRHDPAAVLHFGDEDEH
jgi:ribosome-binding factor A